MFSKVLTVIALFGIAAASVPIVIQPVNHSPQPYKFGYDIKDKHGEQYREEEGTGASAVKGSYGFTDVRGVKRQVNYIADHAGFRAQVKTNEPGTANQNPAAVQMISNAPYAGGLALGGIGLGASGLGYGNLGNVVAASGAAGLGYGNIGYTAAARGATYNLGYNGLGSYGLGVPSLGYARYGY